MAAGTTEGATAASRFRAVRTQLLQQPPVTWQQRRAALTDLTDTWLTSLFHAAHPDSGMALVAVGGYGRRELSPGSDIDVVLLHHPAADATQVAEAIWYPVWDSGLRLDHSVRTPAQARTMANNDVKVMLGLLDARTIVGDPTLLENLQASTLTDWRARAQLRLDDLRGLIAMRQRNFGELAYAQEPDLKESIGGLRDVVIMRAVAASWVTDVPHKRLTEPYSFLLDVRDALHSVTGRNSDKLVRQEQAAVAQLLDIEDPRGDGDGLLRRVAAAGRTIDWAGDVVWHRVDRLRRPSRLPGIRRNRSTTPVRVPLTEGAVVADGEVVLARDVRPSRDPGLLLRVASASARAGLRIAPATVKRLAESVPEMPTPWTDAMRNDFVGLLGAGRGLLPIWEALDQEGLTTALIAPWEDTRSAPQHNPVHLFTVDRHLVETAIRAAAYSREVSRPDLLVVAAMLHDIAKPGHGIDHAQVGAQMVAEVLPGMGFNATDTALVARLVDNHLLLAEVATKRDIADPATLAAVAERVADLDELELLWALCRADAEATGPQASSPWRMALVDSLVEQVAALYSGRPDIALPSESESEQIAAAASDVVVLRDRRSGLEELVIGTPAMPLSDVAGVLAIHRLAVIEAVISPRQGRSVSTWRVLPSFGEPPDAHRLAVDLRRVLDGSLPVHKRLAREEPQPGRSTPQPKVVEVPGASTQATVLEVRAADATGLLYRLLRAIEGAGVELRAAKVATLGADVVDVFYLVDGHGQPLSAVASADLARALRRASGATQDSDGKSKAR
jgi:[protein-PII] uridylyltransferase